MPLACNLSSLQIDAAHEYVDSETYPFTRKSQAKKRNPWVPFFIVGGERGILCIYLNIIVHYQ